MLQGWVSCSGDLGRCTFLFVNMRCISGRRLSLATAGRCCLLASTSAQTAASILLRKPATRVCRSAGGGPLWTAHKSSEGLQFSGKAELYCSRLCSTIAEGHAPRSLGRIAGCADVLWHFCLPAQPMTDC